MKHPDFLHVCRGLNYKSSTSKSLKIRKALGKSISKMIPGVKFKNVKNLISVLTLKFWGMKMYMKA